jgi:hypothetical protein
MSSARGLRAVSCAHPLSDDDETMQQRQDMSDQDLLVAKQAAMEIVMLTMIRPLAGNPRFWADVDAVVAGFERSSPDEVAAFPQRWQATRDVLQQWRRALTGNGNA